MDENHITLTDKHIVVLRNGNVGAVSSFNGQAYLIVFASFVVQMSKYNEQLKHKNAQYDIVKIHDGSSIEDVKDIFKKKFSYDNLNVIWSE